MSATPTKPIHIACNIDSNYLKYCTVMLTSLLENNGSEEIHIHIIGSQLNDDDRLKLRSLTEGKYRQKCSFYSPEDELLSLCRVDERSYISLATYYRVFLDRILPQHINKVIYLDCDLIVNGSIKGLWDQDISDVSVGAVDDMFGGLSSSFERLHYPAEKGYFNAGVILINLDKLRKGNFSERASVFLKNHVSELVYYDQDVLNALLYNDKKMLPLRWNIQDGFLRRRRVQRMTADSLKKIDKEIDNTVIIHYTGSKKPWHYKSEHPWKRLYFKYLDMTEYRGERPVTPFGYKVLSHINKCLELLHLRKRRYFKYALNEA